MKGALRSIGAEAAAAEVGPAPRRMRIAIRRLALDACIGVDPCEQLGSQPVLLDLEFDLPHLRATRSDALADTIDYAAVIERLRSVARRRHQLVEAMAQSMADVLTGEFDVAWLCLTLSKSVPFPGAEVGVVLECGQPAQQKAPRIA